MPFLKRLGLGSSTSSPSPNNKKQTNLLSSRSPPTPSNSSTSSISTTQSNTQIPPSPASSNRSSMASQASSATPSTYSTAFSKAEEGSMKNRLHQRSGSESIATSVAQPSAVLSRMEFVEEIVDDYTQGEQQGPVRDPGPYGLAVSGANNGATGRTLPYRKPSISQQLQDLGHHRARSMPSLSSKDSQKLQQQIAMATRTPSSAAATPATYHANDPSRTRPLRRPESMIVPSSSASYASQQYHSLPSRRVTLNPGAALSTSTLQSALQPSSQERSSTLTKAVKGQRNRNKTVSMGFVNTNRWASRGGIGQKNEMMVDLETSGVFVPETGGRLRPEFVYNITTQCADEIRARGLAHPNLFQNPAPKKVINSMISLLTDRQRCELFSIKCMRIDTVASLLLNTISRMSNPIIPYDMMDYFYGHQFTIVPAAPQHPERTESSSSSSSSSFFSSRPASMALTPSSSPRNSLVSPPMSSSGSPANSNTTSPWSSSSSSSSLSSSSSSYYYQHPFHHYQQTLPFSTTWARHYFDLPLFLDSLPAINRSILLEVLHLCQEVLEYASENLVTIASLSQVVSTALFSSVFDHKLLDRMAGTKRASIHGDGISALEGVKQECQMFSAILVRFLVMTDASGGGSHGGSLPGQMGSSPSSSPAMMTMGMAEMIHQLQYQQPTMLLTPMPSPHHSDPTLASSSTVSFTSTTSTTAATANNAMAHHARVTNRLSCPNLSAGLPVVPVSIATAKRTSMSPRPSVSEIRATQQQYHHPFYATHPSYPNRVDQELEHKRRSMPPPMIATATAAAAAAATTTAATTTTTTEYAHGKPTMMAIAIGLKDEDNNNNEEEVKQPPAMALRPMTTTKSRPPHPVQIVVSSAPTMVSSKAAA
ncbi:hypothetical protein DFQ27_003915 [Actinomortierella ambigua]|uniref:Rho-GAP domain-containing protein n=1 Tax=Actinomortierella ambigua TaxID=1343610 RepID=A0A9P6Q7K4_9FUNG|nr:hypothetical protein DFQ27_003915 [Actinomortierella ambigua]